ncbi:9725_t:CDS:1, partial [Racocetra persica]
VKKKRAKSSWIWQYFKETTSRDENGVEVPIIVCQIKKNDGTNANCDTKYNYASQSTGNAITHLQNLHELCKTGKID